MGREQSKPTRPQAHGVPERQKFDPAGFHPVNQDIRRANDKLSGAVHPARPTNMRLIAERGLDNPCHLVRQFRRGRRGVFCRDRCINYRDVRDIVA